MKHWFMSSLVVVSILAILVGCAGQATPSQPKATAPETKTAPAPPAAQKESAPAAAAKRETAPAAAAKKEAAPVAKKEPVTVEEKLAAVNGLAPDSRQAKLIEEAKKEGKVTYYSVMQIDRIRATEKAFKEKYPFLNTEFVRLTTEELLQKAPAEARAGRQLADVVTVSSVEYNELVKQGVIGKYLSPERNAFHKEFIDKEGYWSASHADAEVVVYNKDLVKREDLPKTLEDLLDAKWKDKVSRTRAGGRWLAGIMKVMGEDKALDFAQKLAQQRVTLTGSNSQVVQFVTSGETPLGFDVHASVVQGQIEKGAPLGMHIMEPMFFFISNVGLAKAAPHPYSAALLTDYLLSKEGQQIAADFSANGGRSDIAYPFTAELKAVKTLATYTAELTGDRYDEYQKKFESLFVRR